MAWTVAQIRKAFPNPMQATGYNKSCYHCYCVGGAFQLFVQKHVADEREIDECVSVVSRYPVTEVLATAIEECSTLNKYQSLAVAVKIVRANDSTDFDTAWKALEVVEKHQREC